MQNLATIGSESRSSFKTGALTWWADAVLAVTYCGPNAVAITNAQFTPSTR